MWDSIEGIISHEFNELNELIGSQCAIHKPGQAGHDGQELSRFDRLCQVHLISGVKRFHPVFDSCERRQSNCRTLPAQRTLKFSNPADKFVAVHVWHSHIRDQYIRLESSIDLEPCVCG